MSYCIYHFKFIAVGFLWFLKRIFNKFSNTSSLFLSEPSQKGFLSCAVTMACGFVRASRSARMAAATRQQTKGSRHMRLLGSVCVCRAFLCVFLWKAKKEKKNAWARGKPPANRRHNGRIPWCAALVLLRSDGSIIGWVYDVSPFLGAPQRGTGRKK